MPENANIYASGYKLYPPDKKKLQAKLQERIDEAEDAGIEYLIMDSFKAER